MEDIKKILQQYDFESDSSDSSDESALDCGAVKKNEKQKKRNGQERMPTRTPDPNVYNRNALLARENRRKKKAYLEAVEKELETARNTNRTLVKKLKKQFKICRRLEQEKQYFKGILANQSEIKSLVSALKMRGTSSSPENSLRSAYRSSRSSSYEPDSVSNNFENNTSNDYEQTSAYDNTWNDLLDENFGLCAKTCETISLNNTVQTNGQTIRDEHSYVKDNVAKHSDESLTTEDPGICLHIAGGKLSLEFCSTCHWNASRTPPTQLLSDVETVNSYKCL